MHKPSRKSLAASAGAGVSRVGFRSWPEPEVVGDTCAGAEECVMVAGVVPAFGAVRVPLGVRVPCEVAVCVEGDVAAILAEDERAV